MVFCGYEDPPGRRVRGQDWGAQEHGQGLEPEGQAAGPPHAGRTPLLHGGGRGSVLRCGACPRVRAHRGLLPRVQSCARGRSAVATAGDGDVLPGGGPGGGRVADRNRRWPGLPAARVPCVEGTDREANWASCWSPTRTVPAGSGWTGSRTSPRATAARSGWSTSPACPRRRSGSRT